MKFSPHLIFDLLIFICLVVISRAQNVGDRLVLGPAPPISSSPNLADQLTKNRYAPNEFRAPIPEEITNRLRAAQGITRITNSNIPHPDNLSNTPRSNPPAQLVNNRFGQDLSEQQILFSNTKQGDRTSPFGERNRLFTMNKYSEKNGDVDLLETRPSLWSDAAELIKKLGESSSPTFKEAQDFASSAVTLPSRLIQEASQKRQNPNNQANGAPFGEFLPSFVVNNQKKQEKVQDYSNFQQPNSGYQPSIQGSQGNLYSNMQSSLFAHNYQPGGQMQSVADSRKYSTNFEISPMSSISIDSLSSADLLVHSHLPSIQPLNQDSRSLGRFDTKLDRFSEEPIDELVRQRVVLNPLDPAFQSGITVDSFLKRPTNFGKTANQGYSITEEARSRQGMVAQGSRSPFYGYTHQQNYNYGHISPVRNVLIAGSEAADKTVATMPAVIAVDNPSGAKTTILTNERIPAWEEAPRGSGGGYVFEKAPTTTPATNNLDRQEKQFTTYPDYRDPNHLFPVLTNHVKEDPRPASGRRDGRQGRFGGGTNEYREDLGQRAPITGINDQRQPGALAGPYEYERLPVAPAPLLNQFSGRVGVENYPAGPYPNKGAINSINTKRIVLGGDDLSSTDVAGHVDFGQRVNAEFTTPAPYLYGSVTTAVIGVPLEKLKSVNKDGRGPASSLVGTGFNPIMDRVVINPDHDSRQAGSMSEYSGPEEITRSRYRNLDETRNAINGGSGGRGPNRYVKMELLNE
uniref:Uncharacterized protein n=1 Tax=Ditylenchus dipsaci TaxID=166011 RepID=A0A915DSE6_9BILA